VGKVTNEEKQESLDELYDRLHKLESTGNKKRNTARYLIDRDRLRREIRDLKDTLTTEEFEKMMKDVIDIDKDKC
jgi:hypothetical protein